MLAAAGGAVVQRAQPRPADPRSPSAMRALLPLLSVGRGWRVGAAARPPRRVMSLYRTEKRGQPGSQDYRVFFSKSLAGVRAGRSGSRAQGQGGGDGSRHAAWTRRARGANRPLQRPPRRGPAALPRRPPGCKPFPLRTGAQNVGHGGLHSLRACDPAVSAGVFPGRKWEGNVSQALGSACV